MKQYVILTLEDLSRELRLVVERDHPINWETCDKQEELIDGFTYIKREVVKSELIEELFK